MSDIRGVCGAVGIIMVILSIMAIGDEHCNTGVGSVIGIIFFGGFGILLIISEFLFIGV